MKPIVSRSPSKPSLEAATEKTSLQLAGDIDDVVASPWIGLHYKHELLLHYKHESLELTISTADRRRQAPTHLTPPAAIVDPDRRWTDRVQ